MKKAQKDYTAVVKILKNEGVKERVFSAAESYIKWTAEEKQLKWFYENKLYIDAVVTLFYDLKKKLKRVPTQDEYVNEYIKITMIHLKNKEWYDPFQKDFFIHCITWRADRSYKSNLIEIMTAGQLELLGYQVFKDLYIDYVVGVDLVAVKDGKCWYIHITKDSKWAREKVLTKGSYRNYTINKKKVYFQRNFSRHVKLLYNCEDSKKNTVNNGLPLFKNNYLLSKLDEKHALNWDDNQLKKLVNEIKTKKAETGNFCFKSTDEKLVVA